jgi:hypothetical protein
MNRTRPAGPLVLAACVTAIAAGGAVAAAQSSPAGTSGGGQTIELKVPLTHFKFIDNAPKGESTGDRDLDYGDLADATTGAHRGVLIQACDFAKLGRRAVSYCSGGLQLGGGNIDFALAGVEKGRVSTYAITGGSGDYATARGTVVFTPPRKGNPFKGIRVSVRLAG